MKSRLARGALAALATALLHPAEAVAQPRLHVSGSASVTESYDDNLFAAPDGRRQDVVSRLGARLRLACLSPRLRVEARAGRDAEAFQHHRELTTARARQEAGVDLAWSPPGRLAASAGASYVETLSPGELTAMDDFGLAGLELRRGRAHRLAATAALSIRLGARTGMAVTHGATWDDIQGGVSSATRTAAASIRRQAGPLDAFTLAYGVRRFTAAAHDAVSHTLTLAWARDVTARTRLELKAGPRLAGGQAGPELEAALRHRFRRGAATLSYVQTEAAIIGRPSPAVAQGLSASLDWSLGRSFTVAAGPSVFEARGAGLHSTTYGMALHLTRALGRRLSLVGSHQLSVQHDEVDGRRRGEIVRNTVRIGLVAGAVD